jgi:predicted dehydrogenase
MTVPGRGKPFTPVDGLDPCSNPHMPPEAQASLSIRKPRAIILGCGAIAELFHAPAFRALEAVGEVEVTHVFDPSSARVARLLQQFGRAKPLGGLDELEALRPDLVVVASPVQFHAGQSISALQAGAAVLCEKPMAASVHEAQQMLAAAVQAGRPLAVGLCRRFLPAAGAIRELLASGALGAIRSFEYWEGGEFKWPAKTPTFFQKSAGGGGALMDVGVHVLDLLAWWFGDPVDLTYYDDAMGGVEANCDLRLTYSPGFTGRVKLSRDWKIRNGLRIQGERGAVSWSLAEAKRLTLELAGFSRVWDIQVKSPPNQKDVSGLEGCFIAQARDVLTACRGDAPLLVSGTEGLRSLQVIETCYARRRSLPLPWFTAEETRAVPAVPTP